MRAPSRLIFATAAFLLGALVAVPTLAAEKIDWQGLELEPAIEKAADNKQIIMIDVYASWCGPCHQLDRQTFPNADVVELSQKFLPLKVNGETPPGEAIMDRYHVVAFPTILFLKPDGSELDRIVGFVAPEDFVRIAQGYLDGRGTLEDLEKQLAESPDDLKLREDVFFRHVMRGNEEAALAHAKTLRKGLAALDESNERDNRLASIDFMLAKYLYLRGKKDHDTARDLLERVQKDWPETTYASRADYPLARALLGMGDEDAAFERLQSLVDADPKSVGAYNTVAWFCAREKVRLDWGIAKAKQGLKIDPKSAGLWDTLAELHFVAGDSKAAVEAIDEAIELDPNEPYFAQQRARFTEGESGGGAAKRKSRASDDRAHRREPADEKKGNCKPTDISRVIRTKTSAIRHCYEKELVENPKLHGKMKLQWLIEADGTVDNVSVVESTLAEPAVEQCVARIVKETQFIAPEGGVCRINYPFHFSPTESR